MFCKRCGAVLEPNSRFCPQCGTSVETSPSKFFFIFKILGIACLIIFASWFGYHYYQTLTSETLREIEKNEPMKQESFSGSTNGTTTNALIDPIEKQLQALKAHQITQAYDNLVSKEFQVETNLNSFQEFVKNYPVLTTFESYEIQSHAIREGKAEVIVLLATGKDHIPLHYHLVQEEGQWKIWQMQIILPMSDGAFANPLEHPKQLIPIIEGLLKDLQNQNVDLAYDTYTSQAFREITSKEVFKLYIHNYPIFTHFKTLTIQESVIVNDKGKVVVDLLGLDGISQIFFSLSLEKEEWKVKAIQVTKKEFHEGNETHAIDEILDEKTFLPIIEGQLYALKKKAVEDAYENYTSKEFKATTSLDEFQKFIDAHPIFFEFSNFSFPKLTFNNNIATMVGLLKDMNGHSYPIEFDLNEDDQQWKILHIQISKPIEMINKSKNEPKTE
jgi:hypothetical protein